MRGTGISRIRMDMADSEVLKPSSSLPAAVFRLLRPRQWSKNLLVFGATIFSGNYDEPGLLTKAVIGFAAMCAISSATYVANDLADVERDRQHPTKRHRPLASGAVPKGLGIAIAAVLLLLGLIGTLSLNVTSTEIIAAYIALQVAYNAGLKRSPVADVYCIATGFVLRAVLGATAIEVKISGWLLFCTGALALMIGFGKRRNEFIEQGEQRIASRESLGNYTLSALDGMVLMFATAAALCYGVYTIESTTADHYPGIIMTAPFVFYAISRYVLLIFTRNEGAEPADVLFRDRHLLLSIALFLASAMLALNGLQLPFLER